ncbi:MAG: alginate export family protein [Firmicutes bacterium]|nr:alginate export family protein [Bacillota bacterium]
MKKVVMLLLVIMTMVFPVFAAEGDTAADASKPAEPGSVQEGTTAKQEDKNFKLEFNIRNRLESWNNKDFDSSKDDAYSLVRQRYSMMATYKAGEVPFFGELRFVRTDLSPFTSLELQQLYMDVGKDLRMRLGRQMMSFGDGRVISNRPWGDTQIVFDGVRLTAKEKYFTADMLALNRFQYHKPGVGQERLYGMYAAWKKDQTEIDGYFLTKEIDQGAYDDGLKQIRVTGLRFKQESGNWTYGFEGMRQFGCDSDKQRDAYALVTYGSYTFNKHPWKPSLGFNYDYFSGDSNPDDNVIHTYDDFYQKNHSFLGHMDLIGCKNVRDLGFVTTSQPNKFWKTYMAYHIFNLDKARDAWYGTNGKPFLQDPTGRSGTDMGTEFDFNVRYTKKIWDINVGYSRFWPGAFVKNIYGGKADPADFFYLQIENKF